MIEFAAALARLLASVKVVGADGSGLQALLASPVRLRDIVIAKNLAHTLVLVVEMLTVWVVVSVLYKAPTLDVVLVTLAGIAFAAPVNFLARKESVPQFNPVIAALTPTGDEPDPGVGLAATCEP